mmetsp:Transcript_7463/g.16140  ORF Transcript_7463/g.16140 Transcript_7463/m.16140 type:complete len:307 (+) Transcript_7463:644-1564(+)
MIPQMQLQACLPSELLQQTRPQILGHLLCPHRDYHYFEAATSAWNHRSSGSVETWIDRQAFEQHSPWKLYPPTMPLRYFPAWIEPTTRSPPLLPNSPSLFSSPPFPSLRRMWLCLENTRFRGGDRYYFHRIRSSCRNRPHVNSTCCSSHHLPLDDYSSENHENREDRRRNTCDRTIRVGSGYRTVRRDYGVVRCPAGRCRRDTIPSRRYYRDTWRMILPCRNIRHDGGHYRDGIPRYLADSSHGDDDDERPPWDDDILHHCCDDDRILRRCNGRRRMVVCGFRIPPDRDNCNDSKNHCSDSPPFYR